MAAAGGVSPLCAGREAGQLKVRERHQPESGSLKHVAPDLERVHSKGGKRDVELEREGVER